VVIAAREEKESEEKESAERRSFGVRIGREVVKHCVVRMLWLWRVEE
jgi:hypothetical protein